MCDSVAATLAALLAHQGELVQPIGADAPEITARFRDPAGNANEAGRDGSRRKSLRIDSRILKKTLRSSGRSVSEPWDSTVISCFGFFH
jgi:hypothetical protein